MDLCIYMFCVCKTGLLLRALAALNPKQNLFQLLIFHDFMYKINFKLCIFVLQNLL